ncbi:MAG TPA: ATP-binding protein [Gemmatimonadaceae bacterium]|nr:ATP-binding protein [Gemmatimonadaceae bacterium]
MEERLRVLVVDDDDVDRMAVRRSLKASGIDAEITEAEDAATALERIRSASYDCALFDFRMPGSDGLELLRQIRADGVGTPVIMLTGFGDEQTAVDLMKAGAADYLPKNSLTPERLGQSVRSVVRVREAEVEAGRAENQLRTYATQLRSLAEAAIAINSTLAADAMLQVATESARRILNTRRAETRLTEETLTSGAMRGISPEQAAAIWHASEPEEKITSWTDVTREMRTVDLEALSDSVLDDGALLRNDPDESYLSAPLVGRNGRTLGVIQLWGKKDGKFSEGDEAILTQLAQMCSVALENARLYKAAQDATRARDDLVAIVSHDLRNPIHTINMAASFLLDVAPADDRRVTSRRQLEVIRRSANRANRLISDLLDVARIQAGGLAVEPVPVDAASLVQEAMEAAAPLATGKKLTIEREVPENLPAVCSDRDRVLQVFGNLIGNAIKFTPEGGRITIRAESETLAVRFSVRDTGPGIPPEHAAHVFDRYWQAKSTAKLGTGLGLSIAKGIVEAHSGRIWVESEPGQGASFFFTLPAAPSTGADLA